MQPSVPGIWILSGAFLHHHSQEQVYIVGHIILCCFAGNLIAISFTGCIDLMGFLLPAGKSGKTQKDTAHDQQKKTCQKDFLPAYLLYTESVALFFSKGWFLVFCIHICIVSVTDRFDQLKNMIFLLKISEDCPVKLQNMI